MKEGANNLATNEGLQANFRAHAHVLRLLGEQLVGNNRLALFELVKNAYDADADWAKVTLDLVGLPHRITVQDNGCGMDLNTIRAGWFVLGTDLKRGQNRKKTENYKRMPLGEKGVGRLATFRLGSKISVTTRAKDCPEYHFTISLPSGDNLSPSLGKVGTKIEVNDPPEFFKGTKTGTLIRIKGINYEDWARGEVRNLARMVTMLVSPFEQVNTTFDVKLSVPGHEDWIKDILDADDIVNLATWRVKFHLSPSHFDWKYTFTPPMKYRTLTKKSMTRINTVPEGKLPFLNEDGSTPKGLSNLYVGDADFYGIGSLSGEIRIFHRRSEVIGNLRQVKGYLDENTGVRVYRDGIRVYNYGEPGEDWLGLDTRRILKPSARMGNKSVMAAVHLEMEESCGLIEKTNREGFDENKTFRKFRQIMMSLMAFVDLLRQDDREELDKAIRGQDSLGEPGPDKFAKAMHALRKGLQSKHLEKEFEPHLSAIEREYESLRNFTVSAGNTGLNISLIFHEVERETRNLLEDIIKERQHATIQERAVFLRKLLEDVSSILRAPRAGTFKASLLLKRAGELAQARFRVHKILFDFPILGEPKCDFEIKGSLNVCVGIIQNLIDNSIYWIRRRREQESKNWKGIISVRILPNWTSEGPSIAIVDNGVGFSISQEKALEAFYSTKPDGMGLGLFYSKMAMEAHGGRLLVVAPSDLDTDLGNRLDGAAVVLCFPGGRV